LDQHNEDLINKNMKQYFDDSYTILTIAHKIKSILDSDKIILVDKGKIVEFDTPEKLISQPDSLFNQLYQANLKNL